MNALASIPLRSAMIDARFAQARPKLRPRPIATLSDTHVLQLAFQWFHQAE